MNLNPCISLHFNGVCEAAFKFYERCFSGKIQMMMTWDQSPMANTAPPGWGQKILYARISIGSADMVGADVAIQQHEEPKGFSVLLNIDDLESAERIFNTLAENGKITMPLQQTFWAQRYGGVVDQFGIPWEINCEQPAR